MILYQSITGQIQCAKLGHEDPVLVWREWPEGEPGPWQVAGPIEVARIVCEGESYGQQIEDGRANLLYVRAHCIAFCWQEKRTGWYDVPSKSEEIRQKIIDLHLELETAIAAERAMLDEMIDARWKTSEI